MRLHIAHQRLRPHNPRFRQRPIGEMHQTCFPQCSLRIPFLVIVPQIRRVVCRPEFPAQQPVFAVREHHGGGAVECVEDFHVEVIGGEGGGVGGGHEARGFAGRGLEEDEQGGEGVDGGGGPVGAHHGDGGGGEEEEVVEVVEDCHVGVEVDDAEVLGLVEGEELGEGGIPCEIIYSSVEHQHRSSILKRKNPFAIHRRLQYGGKGHIPPPLSPFR